MKYFKNLKTEKEIREQFKKLVLKYHPDRGGSNKIMTEINLEFEQAMKNVKNNVSYESLDDGFLNVIDKIAGLNLDIELCGQWLWIGGNTKPYKDILKQAGCFWASKKKLWYWRPEEARIHSRSSKSIEEIRNKYGSKKVTATNNKKCWLLNKNTCIYS